MKCLALWYDGIYSRAFLGLNLSNYWRFKCKSVESDEANKSFEQKSYETEEDNSIIVAVEEA